jgi:hypothetical protein
MDPNDAYDAIHEGAPPIAPTPPPNVDSNEPDAAIRKGDPPIAPKPCSKSQNAPSLSNQQLPIRGLSVRARPWFIGIFLLAFGIATHVANWMYVAPNGIRQGMGHFACVEFVLYAAGLALLFIDLGRRAAGTLHLVLGCFALIIAAFLALVAVLISLPP